MEFENTLIIERPASEIFVYLADLTNLPAWNYAISRTTQKTPGSIGMGTRYIQQRTLPSSMTEELEITTYTPDHQLSVTGNFAYFTGTSTYELTPLNPSRTRLTNHMTLKATGIPQLIAPLAAMKLKGAVAKNLTVLKQIVEGRQ